jgi:hypothetical protein
MHWDSHTHVFYVGVVGVGRRVANHPQGRELGER